MKAPPTTVADISRNAPSSQQKITNVTGTSALASRITNGTRLRFRSKLTSMVAAMYANKPTRKTFQ